MNFDTVEVVIQRLISMFKLREWQYDIEDLVEDIAEALKHIGAASLYLDKVVEITMNQNMGKIPAGVQNVKHLIPMGMPYKEQGGFIVANVSDGSIIQAVCQTMPVDSRGYPLVPDNVAVREAVMWYMVKILILQKEITTVGYDFADKEWDWRCGSARAELNVMNIHEWSGVANDFTRLNPIKDVHRKEYVEIGKNNTLNRDRERNIDLDGESNINSQQIPD